MTTEIDALEIRMIPVEETRTLRRDVLRPGLPMTAIEYSGEEDLTAFHLGGFLRGRLLGVATFHPEPCPCDPRGGDWRLRGMATHEEFRGRGIGGALLSLGMREATARQAERLWCNGRTSARRFYERHGMEAVGEEFESPVSGPHFVFVADLKGMRGGVEL